MTKQQSIKIQPMKLYFACDRCFNKLPFKEAFKLRRNVKTICEHCQTELKPIYPISLNWSFFVGFVCTTIPAELYLKFYADLLVAFGLALTGGIIGLVGVVLFVYNSTEFTSVS